MGVFDWLSKNFGPDKNLKAEYAELNRAKNESLRSITQFYALSEDFMKRYSDRINTLTPDETEKALKQVQKINEEARNVLGIQGILSRDIFAWLGVIDYQTKYLRQTAVISAKKIDFDKVLEDEAKMLGQAWENFINNVNSTKKEYEKEKKIIRSLRKAA